MKNQRYFIGESPVSRREWEAYQESGRTEVEYGRLMTARRAILSALAMIEDEMGIPRSVSARY